MFFECRNWLAEIGTSSVNQHAPILNMSLHCQSTHKMNTAITHSEMIAAGRYDFVSKNIDEDRLVVPENFVPGTEYRFDNGPYVWSPEKAMAEAKKRGFRFANVSDLLDYGSKYPDAPKFGDIVALDSAATYHGDRTFIGIRRYLEKRCLDIVIVNHDSDWGHKHVKFLMVRI